MSDLTGVDKIYLEKILNMGGGYVLDFNNVAFGQFFRRLGVEIHSAQYQIYSTSKANKMRAFWERESDAVVGEVGWTLQLGQRRGQVKRDSRWKV